LLTGVTAPGLHLAGEGTNDLDGWRWSAQMVICKSRKLALCLHIRATDARREEEPMSESIRTKTTFFGNTVKDDAGEPVQEIVDEEGDVKGEIRTSTSFWGNTRKDDAGEPIREIVNPEGEVTHEIRTSTTFWGNTRKDDAGEPIKEIVPKD
jgi:hypothetical protein